MFEKGTIWAYPTDTSFGLGVRADDTEGLSNLARLKHRSGDKYFSLMVRDWAMLEAFAVIPTGLSVDFFRTKPRTAILKPKSSLPKTSFWPADKVAFRLCMMPDIAKVIDYPITATSANISTKEPIYEASLLPVELGHSIRIYHTEKPLPVVKPSEIWDFTGELVRCIRF